MHPRRRCTRAGGAPALPPAVHPGSWSSPAAAAGRRGSKALVSAAWAPRDVTRRRPHGAARGSRGLLGSGLPPPPAPAPSFPSLTPPRSHA